METKALHEAIYKRKSVRKYAEEPLEKKILDEISAFIKTTKPLFENVNVEIKIVQKDEMGKFFAIKAPQYILVSSEKKEGYLLNVGFMLQQIDLYLSSKGLGSCWLGVAKPKKYFKLDKNMDYVIALAFGKPLESVHRERLSEFIRKPIDQICHVKDNSFIEAARLAPSATNSQNWYFTGTGDMIHAYRLRLNPIKALIYERLNKIDMGIAFCHIWLAAGQQGREVVFLENQEAKGNPPSGYEYELTVKILAEKKL